MDILDNGPPRDFYLGVHRSSQTCESFQYIFCGKVATLENGSLGEPSDKGEKLFADRPMDCCNAKNLIFSRNFRDFFYF